MAACATGNHREITQAAVTSLSSHAMFWLSLPLLFIPLQLHGVDASCVIPTLL